MRFLSDEQLAEYYGKSVDEISPTDNPKPRYMVGQDTVTCQECGNELDVYCSGHGDDQAYCDNCEIEYMRYRYTPVNDAKYQYTEYRTDEREEYVCSDCSERHPITEPHETFEYETTPKIKDDVYTVIHCPCGNAINISKMEIESALSCDQCSRVYTFQVTNS